MNAHVLICLAIVVGAVAWGVGFFAYWKGWSDGRKEERAGWSLLMKMPCKPPSEQGPHRFENGRPFVEGRPR